MTPRFLLTALLAGASLAGCDSALTAADTPSNAVPLGGVDPDGTLLALRVPLAGAHAGDFVYGLDPLPDGTVFRGRVEFGGRAVAELRSTGTDGGTALTLALDGLSPDSVTVEYLAHGVPVAKPVTYYEAQKNAGEAGETYPAGTSDTEPTSYHYKEVDGVIVIVKDYNSAPASGAWGSVGSEGTLFTTTQGERVHVTDVAFSVHGVDPGSPTAVIFGGTPEFDLEWFDLSE